MEAGIASAVAAGDFDLAQQLITVLKGARDSAPVLELVKKRGGVP